MPDKEDITTPQNRDQIINDALAQPKAYPKADKKPILDEVSSQISDPFWTYYTGSMLLNPDQTLRTEGLQRTDLYEDLLRDPQVRSNMQTRRLAVIGKGWGVDPNGGRQTIADRVKEVFGAFDFDSARYSSMEGILTGFKASEIMWTQSEGDIWISEMRAKPTRRFSFGLNHELRLLTRHNAYEGDAVPPRKFQVFRMPSDNGSDYGDGLGSSLYWMVWFKKNALKFWLIFSEKFGAPTALGMYPPGTPKEQQDALLAALDAIQQETAIKIPDTMKVQFIEAQRSGSMNNYESLLAFLNAEITKVIMGQTLTTEMSKSGGSFAAAKTHNDVRDDYLTADAALLCEQYNRQVVRWLVDYNFGPQKRYPKLVIDAEARQDLLTLAQRDQILQTMGYPVTREYISEKYGLPIPAAGDTTLTPTPGEKAAINDGKNTNSLTMSERPERRHSACACGHDHVHEYSEPGKDEQDWIDQYMERLAPMLAGLQQKAIDELMGWLASFKTPPTEAQFVEGSKRILVNELGQVERAKIADLAGDMYKWYRTTQKLSPHIDIVFGGADLRTSDFLSSLDHFYLSKWISNPQTEKQLTDFLRKQYIEGGDGLFGRGSTAGIRKFREALGQTVKKLSDVDIQRIVDTGVARARNWAHIHQAHSAGIQKLQVVEPTHMCEFCQDINGTEIDVPTAYNEMQMMAGMTPQAYSDYLKAETPFTPPFHPFCHGYLRVI